MDINRINDTLNKLKYQVEICLLSIILEKITIFKNALENEIKNRLLKEQEEEEGIDEVDIIQEE